MRAFYFNFLLGLFLIVQSSSFAQTTLEEYVYVIEGYELQEQHGLPMREGYEMKFCFGIKSINGSARLFALNRIVGEEKEIAAYMIISKLFSKIEYICIPHPDSPEEIRRRFKSQLEGDLNSHDANRLALIVRVLSRKMEWKSHE